MADSNTHIISTYSEKQQGSKWARRHAGAYYFHHIKLHIPSWDCKTLDSIAEQILDQVEKVGVRIGDRVIVVSDKKLPCFSYICVQILHRRFHETVEVEVNVEGITQRVPFVEKLFGRV